jgi:hypothetical protein
MPNLAARVSGWWAQRSLPSRENVPEFVFCRSVLAACGHLLGDAELGGQGVWVVWAQRPLMRSKQVAEFGQRRGMVAACGHLLSDAEASGQGIRVVRPQHVLLLNQFSLMQRDGFVRTPGILVRGYQARVTGQRARVV